MTDVVDQMYGDGYCAVCNTLCAEGMLMCRTHWYMVPRALRNEVLNTLRKYNRSECTLGDLRSVQNRAVAHVGRP